MKGKFFKVALLVVVAVGLPLPASTAWAAFPGTNGKISFESKRDGNDVGASA
jgi:hypothetical protein